ncbi:MAG: DUF11 domain-containing protein, partial [Opitutaceae bacterium]|nr:DUF11 domain-containing protein [Opitutaceae bacterium]
MIRPRASLFSRLRRRALPALLGVLALAPCARAQSSPVTPAGTVIRNQAVITFEQDDASGVVYRATSNEVLIEVAAIYGITLLPDGSTASPGQIQSVVSAATFATRVQATFGYTLRFTGNTPDTATLAPTYASAASTFRPQLPDGDTGILVYSDLNANGQPDSDDVLVSSWRDANNDGEIQPAELQINTLGFTYAPDAVVPLLVTFFVPEALPPGSIAHIGLDGAYVGTRLVTPLPAAGDDVGNIARAVTVNDAVMALTKTVSSAVTNPGGAVTYTVTATNVGTAAALRRSYTVDGTPGYEGVLVFDVLPGVLPTGVAPALSAQTIVAQPGGVSGLLVYASPPPATLAPAFTSWDPTIAADWAWSATYTPGATVIGYLSSTGASDHDIAPGGAVTFSFLATHPADATLQVLENHAYAHYATTTLSPAEQTVRTLNATRLALSRAHGVVIRDTDFEADALHLTAIADDGVADVQRLASVQGGTTVWFTQRVFNTGGGPDSFDITVSAQLDGGAPPPSGYRFTLYRADGLTPLADTGVNGVPDTGLLDPAGADLDNPLAFADVLLRVEVPDAAANLATALEITLTARSIGDSSRADTTLDRIEAVARAAMNLANHTAPVAGPPDETPYARTTAAGGYVDFPLLVQNTAPAAASPGNPAGSPDVYTLSSSVLPAGWRVVFYADPDRDGVVDSGELLPVLRTPEIAPAGRAYVVARVFVPAGTSGDADANPANGRQDYTLTFRAASTNLPAVFDDQVDFVRVGYDDRFELRPDRQGTIEPGGTVQYLHTVRNLGERANRFYLTFTPGRSDWTYTLINADGSALLPTAIDPADGLEKAYVDLTGAAGATPKVDFQLRLFAPARTPLGQTETTFLQVSANDPDAPATPLPVEDLHGVVDVTRVVRGDLVLTKTVDPAENIPVSPG